MASDLRRVSRPASAVALLKRRANLIICVGPPASMGDAQAPANQKQKHPPARGPSGGVRQTTAPITRRPKAQWKFSGCPVSPPDTHRLGKKGGPGSPRRFFRPLLGVQKWARRRHAQPGRLKKVPFGGARRRAPGARGRVAPESQARSGWLRTHPEPGGGMPRLRSRPPGDGRISPAGARSPRKPQPPGYGMKIYT